MKRIILVIFAIFFTTNLFAHSTNIDFDSKVNCTKRKSMLNGIAKLKTHKGGEIIKFNSYTGFDQRTVLIDGHLKNPIEITGYLQLPKGNDKVPIVFYTHSSGGHHCCEYKILLELYHSPLVIVGTPLSQLGFSNVHQLILFFDQIQYMN